MTESKLPKATGLHEKQQELDEILRHFGDSKSMNYFTDRFGYDHSLSELAERGVELEREIRRLKKSQTNR